LRAHGFPLTRSGGITLALPFRERGRGLRIRRGAFDRSLGSSSQVRDWVLARTARLTRRQFRVDRPRRWVHLDLCVQRSVPSAAFPVSPATPRARRTLSRACRFGSISPFSEPVGLPALAKRQPRCQAGLALPAPGQPGRGPLSVSTVRPLRPGTLTGIPLSSACWDGTGRIAQGKSVRLTSEKS
jgi:hypothetical protein